MSKPNPAGRRPSQVPDVAPLVRRVIGARVSDPAAAEDLCQETMERLVAVEGRLDPTALAPYAVVTARSLVVALARRGERDRRHGPRMLDPRQPEDPQEQALREEERQAIAAALERLPAAERQALLAHDVEGLGTRALAERTGTTPGAVAVRLSRARARLRVEYLLVLRRVELPTGSCKRVLWSISTADKRQQRLSGAGEHLLVCEECAALSDPLVHRRRPLAALWPFLGLDHVLRWMRRTARQHPAPSAAAGASAAAVAVAVVVALAGEDPPRPALFVQAGSSIPVSGNEPMAPYAGKAVEARGVPVQSVVGATGFWVGRSPDERVWVYVEGGPPPQLAPGQRVNFRGRLTANTPKTLEGAGTGAPGDRAQVERQGYHIDVAAETIQPVRSGP